MHDLVLPEAEAMRKRSSNIFVLEMAAVAALKKP